MKKVTIKEAQSDFEKRESLVRKIMALRSRCYAAQSVCNVSGNAGNMYLAEVFNYLREEIGMIRDAVDEIEMEVLHGKQK